IGTVRFRQDESDADIYLQSAYKLAKKHNDDLALSQILEYMGYQAGKIKGDHQKALHYYQESFEVAMRLNSVERRFFALLNLGAAEQALNRSEQALNLSQQAYAIAKDTDSKLWMAFALESMGESYHALQEREQAQKRFNDALKLYSAFGSKVNIASLLQIMQAGNYTISDEYIEGVL